MKKWEYRTLTVSKDFSFALLNELGGEGWELITIIRTSTQGGVTLYHDCILKREKIE